MVSLDAASYRRLYGPTTGDVIRLGDSGLTIQVEHDDVAYGDEVLGGCGKTWRDGFYVRRRPNDSELDLLVSNVVLVDPVLGIRKTCIGIKDGRVVGIGRAGSPDVIDGVDLVVGPHTALVPGEGMIATPGAVDSHVHLASPALLDVALSAGVTTMVGMGIGGVWDVGVNPQYNIHTLTEAFRDVPVNILFLARGSTTDRSAMESALAAGAGGFKVHEDYGASPACIDACLDIAEAADVAVALHSDSLNEFGLLADTVEATRGRTVHAYHVEGGGGHPDLLEILSHPHVLGSSTTPTVPYGIHTLDELFPMTMTVHRQNHLLKSDVETTVSRLHEAGIQAENHLHHLGDLDHQQRRPRHGTHRRDASAHLAAGRQHRAASRTPGRRHRYGQQPRGTAVPGQGDGERRLGPRHRRPRGLAATRPARRHRPVGSRVVRGQARARAEVGLRGLGCGGTGQRLDAFVRAPGARALLRRHGWRPPTARGDVRVGGRGGRRRTGAGAAVPAGSRRARDDSL